MAEKYYTSSGEEYYPGATYELIDKNGNVVGESKGDNGYVWQSATQGIPISINQNGEWYTEPYLESDGKKITAHIPEWFKSTNEYSDWSKVSAQIPSMSLTKDTLGELNNYLKQLGGQGAVRVSLWNEAKTAGINSREGQERYYNNMIAMGREGSNDPDYQQDASISLYGDDAKSVKDIAREFKDMSKEDLSRWMTYLYQSVDKGRKGEWNDSDENKADSLFLMKMLNWVDDNYKNYGDKKKGENDEFQGLLEASLWQKFMRGFATASATFAQANFLGTLTTRIPVQLQGESLENRISDVMSTRSDLGANLEGTEAAEKLGGAVGTFANIAETVMVSKGLGKITKGSAAAATPGTFMNRLANTWSGALAVDFFLNDVPIDATFAVTKAMRGENPWIDTERTQPLIKTPLGLVGIEFGPQVPDGMVFDMIGDALIDLAPTIIGVSSGATYRKLDDMTGGGVTRLREKITVANMNLQDKMANVPVIGKAWQTFINKAMTPSNASLVREARRTVIASGSIDWYIRAQNQLTIENTNAASIIGPKVAKLDDEYGISKSIKKFVDNGNDYGGFGRTATKLKKAVAGIENTYTRYVDDRLPRQVKQGLLDVERLAELQGQKANEGGLPFNPARETEIAALEQKVKALPKDIVDFANTFSDYNKAIERLAARLGIKNEDWVDAIALDPQYAKYMVRQVLIPGEPRSTTGATDISKSAIWTKTRTGEYSDNYIDPTQALDLKIEALGRAYAWNERSKLVAEMQVAQGKVQAGQSSVEVAKDLERVKNEIRGSKELRNKIGYDESVSKYAHEAAVVADSFRKVNDIMSGPENINLKAIYDAQNNPQIKSLVKDFADGRLQVEEDVASKAGITSSDVVDVISNTYVLKGMMSTPATSKTPKGDIGMDSINGMVSKSDTLYSSKKTEYDVPDSTTRVPTELDYNAGVTMDGRPFKYTIEDGKITDMEAITDAEGLAESINHFGGVYRVDPKTIDDIGPENAYALNRTILYYRNEMPNLGLGPTFKAKYHHDKGVYGWIPTPGAYQNQPEYNFRVEDGHIVADEFPVYLGLDFHAKGKEKLLRDSIQDDVNARFHPKNSTFLENVPVHETGHNYMARLAILELNRKIDEGLIKLPENASEMEINRLVYRSWEDVHELAAKNALEKMGLKYSLAEWKRQAGNISRYAGSGDYAEPAFKYETFSEAQVDYKANGANANPFSLASLEQVKRIAERHTVAASPADIMAKNNLAAPKGLFKDGQYAFSKTTKTDAGKAKWLTKWRENNPYTKAKNFDDDTYIKANLWDTFFQKEITSYDPKTKTAMPDKLAELNGKFLDEYAKNAAKNMVAEIKKASVEGFSEELAVMALSKNSEDIGEALDNYIIKKVNDAANNIASKMPGGMTEENLNKARLTLWSEPGLKNDTVAMLSALVPEVAKSDVLQRVNTLFDTQAKGFASLEPLAIDTAKLIGERNKLLSELGKNNRYARRVGKELDKKLEGWDGDTTQIIHYKQAGEDVYVVVNDPVTASILKKPYNYKETGMIGESAAYIANFTARTYRLGTTGLNPVNLITNVLRDPIQATIQGGFNPLTMSLDPQMFYRTLNQFGLDEKTIKEVTEQLKSWANENTLTQRMRALELANPNDMGYRNSTEKVIKNFNKKFFENKLVETGEAPLEAWESMFRNQIAQQSFIRNYQRTGDVNKAMASAMFDASNSTTNFTHALGMFKKSTGTVPYLMSAINGTRSFWVQFNADPVGMVGRITAGFMVPAMAITAWNLSDPDRRERYLSLPEWYRDTHIVLVDLSGDVIAAPIPDELGQYYGTTRRLVEYTNNINKQGIPSILLQGAFGFLPSDVDGFFADDGSINVNRGALQLASGLLPQVVTTIYEFVAEKDLYTGADLSNYTEVNKWINALSNTFGTGIKQAINDIGLMCGGSEKDLVGKSTANTLARNLFGLGFDEATSQFMNMIGKPSEVVDGKETKATGLFAENELLQKEIEGLNKKVATSAGEEKAGYEKQIQEKIDAFTQKVSNLTHNYMELYTVTGGLKDWQKSKIVSLLTLGSASSTASSDSYQNNDMSQAYLNERSLAQQRYLNAGLPGGASREGILNGNDSIAVQAALNRVYGVPKQAAADFKSAVKESKLKEIRSEFYDAISKIYDIADETNTTPDYDMIEKIQARYLQSVDNVLIPIINQYGMNILNNSDFIETVNNYVNGMVPSNDWRQSGKNARKYLSTKEFPLATVDTKKWLIQRYSTGMKNRNIASDSIVTEKITEIKSDIDAGRSGAAKGKITDLVNGIRKSNFYISSQDMQTLTELNNMVK